MRAMQAKILTQIEREAIDRSGSKVEVVQTTSFANTGMLYLQEGLVTYARIEYSFQDTYASIKIAISEELLLDLRDVLAGATHPKNLGRTVAYFHSLKYDDTKGLTALVHAVGSIAAEAVRTPRRQP